MEKMSDAETIAIARVRTTLTALIDQISQIDPEADRAVCSAAVTQVLAVFIGDACCEACFAKRLRATHRFLAYSARKAFKGIQRMKAEALQEEAAEAVKH